MKLLSLLSLFFLVSFISFHQNFFLIFCFKALFLILFIDRDVTISIYLVLSEYFYSLPFQQFDSIIFHLWFTMSESWFIFTLIRFLQVIKVVIADEVFISLVVCKSSYLLSHFCRSLANF